MSRSSFWLKKVFVVYKVYKLTCAVTGKSYIGYTKKKVTERFAEHARAERENGTPKYKIHRAIKKYGADSFSVETIASSNNRKEIGIFEDYFIMVYDTINNGYNIARGGQGGCIALFKENPEYDNIRKKMSIAQKKRSKEISEQAKRQHASGGIRPKDYVYSDETRAKLSKIRKGKRNSAEHIAKQKASLCATLNAPGYVNPNIGRKRSSEVCKNISENHADVSGAANPMFGKKHSDSAKEKLRERALNREKRFCEHCGRKIDKSNYVRWHGNKCVNRGR